MRRRTRTDEAQVLLHEDIFIHILEFLPVRTILRTICLLNKQTHKLLVASASKAGQYLWRTIYQRSFKNIPELDNSNRKSWLSLYQQRILDGDKENLVITVFKQRVAYAHNICNQQYNFLMGKSPDEEDQVQLVKSKSDLPIFTTRSAMGYLQQGMAVILKGNPCAISTILHSRIGGKYGTAKTLIVAYCIFTMKRIEQLNPSSAVVHCPLVNFKTYELIDIMDDYAHVLAERDEDDWYEKNNFNGIKDSLLIPANAEGEKLKKRFKQLSQSNSALFIRIKVLQTMGHERIIDWQEVLE